MQLFEANRGQFLKIFETHQFKGLISFTDILKICSSLKIFPDLVDSQEVQKIFSSVSSGNFYKITYLEFEDFLRALSLKVFGRGGDFGDSFEIFLSHIRIYALKAYGIEVKVYLSKRRSLSKHLKSNKQLSLSSIKNKSAVKAPETTRNMTSKKNLLDLVNPGIVRLKKKKLKKFKENLQGVKVSGQEKVKLALSELKKVDLGKKILASRKLDWCQEIVGVGRGRTLLVKMYFHLWKLRV